MPLLSLPTLAERLTSARSASDALFDIVKPDCLYERPIAERHRIVFYIGHLEAFDRNLFDRRLFDLPSADPQLDRLFAFGIDPVGSALPTDTPADWPRLETIRDYVRDARVRIDTQLAALDLPHNAPAHDPAPQLLNVAIEHRLMHVETLCYMFHQLPFEQKRVSATQAAATSDERRTVPLSRVVIPAGRTELGMTTERGLFGWDNEFGEDTIDVPPFEIDRHMVNNAAFLEFMGDGGYTNRALWTDADWAWKEAAHVTHPAFWTPGETGWRLRTMFDEIPLPLAWPVYVSHAEASAFARWRSAHLPSEPQWQRAAHGARPDETDNFDFRNWNPTAVDATPDSASTWGVEGLYGNGWEWTSTPFGPLPGFKAFPFYEGYSANFFDGQHYVMKGGSPLTARCMVRPTFRNWFQAHYPYTYAGFRCVS